MTTVSIIGTGNMGKALASLFERPGLQVQQIERGEPSSTIDGELVVLAVPYAALDDIASTFGDRLTGKVVVDITNPVDFATFAPIKPAAGSAAAQLATAVPGARVVKAFNTNFAATLATGKVDQTPVAVIVAGDDAEAKTLLNEAVVSSGAAAFDAGGLDRAAELEAVGYLQIVLARSGQIGWTNGFALHP